MNKKEAWRYYKTWMKEKTYCKALKSEVKITKRGWDHLTFGTKAIEELQRTNLIELIC